MGTRRHRLAGLVAAVVALPTSVAVAQVVGDRVVQANGVLSTYGDPIVVGEAEIAWSTHEWVADLAVGGAQATDAPAPTEDVVLQVSPSGADSGDGTATSPVASIGRALALADRVNRDGRSVRIQVASGTYRELVQLSRSADATTAPIVIEGIGNVVVSGADVYDDWTPQPDGSFATAWDHDWGPEPMPARWAESYAGDELAANPAILRREVVVVNGRRLTQVTSPAAFASTAESFLVDEARDRLLIRTATDPRQAQVEIAERDVALRIGSRQNVTVRNIDFVQTATRIEQKGVQVNQSEGIRIVDVDVRHHSWHGLGIYQSDDVIVLRTRANDNGVGGMTAFGSSGLLFEDTETSRNNWRGAIGQLGTPQGDVNDLNFIDFAGGQKFFRLDGATFRRHRATDNASSGMWFDYDNRNVVVEDSIITGNRTWGIFFEANPGPLAVRRSTISGNEFGVTIGNSARGTISDSTIAGNVVSQIFVSGRDSRSIVATDGSNVTLRSQDWTVTGNSIGTDTRDDGIETHLPSASWDHFVATLTYTGNTFTGRR